MRQDVARTGESNGSPGGPHGTRPTSPAAVDVDDVGAVRARVGRRIVGRERELDLVLAAVAAGRDIVLE